MRDIKEQKFCFFRSDYWNEKCIGIDIHVPAEHYKSSTKDDIERELARRIGEELLDKNLLCFSDSWKPDAYGDIRVHCQANVLELKDRKGKMPSRLRDIDNSWLESYMNPSKGVEPMNDPDETK